MNLSTYDLVSLASPHYSYKLWGDKNPKEKKDPGCIISHTTMYGQIRSFNFSMPKKNPFY